MKSSEINNIFYTLYTKEIKGDMWGEIGWCEEKYGVMWREMGRCEEKWGDVTSKVCQNLTIPSQGASKVKIASDRYWWQLSDAIIKIK